MRIFSSISLNFKITKQADISTAFLYGKSDEDIHHQLSEGQKLKQGNALVCKTRCTIYGLGNAAKCWFDVFNNFLKEQRINLFTSRKAVREILLLFFYFTLMKTFTVEKRLKLKILMKP